MNARRPTIGFVGLSHLGICSAAAAAARGFPTIGYDDDHHLTTRLSQGVPPVTEPGLGELVAEHRERLAFGSEASVLRACDIVYVALDVPTDDEGRGDLTPVRDVIAQAAGVLRDDAVLVVLCQVPPGFTRSLPVPRERLYYQVETLIFGRAVERATHPERFIIGCAHPDAPLDRRLRAFLDAFGCPVLPMRYESAELAKISINMCLVASISVANTLAEICEKIGADWSEIVPALKLDRRIGPHSYLAPGLGLAGGNLERDLDTVLRLADTCGTDGGVVAAWVANSRHRKDWAWRTLEVMVLASQPEASIAVWGLAYKENTHSTKNSPALALLARLQEGQVAVYDPVVPAEATGLTLKGAVSALAASEGADALCIMTPWPEFKAIAPSEIAARMRGRVVLDPYRVLDPAAALTAGLRYATLGAPLVGA